MTETVFDKLNEASALQAISHLPAEVGKLRYDIRFNGTAVLAAAIIQAMGRPVSVKEALELQQDIYNANFGGELGGYGHYQEWKKTGEERIRKVRT